MPTRPSVVRSAIGAVRLIHPFPVAMVVSNSVVLLVIAHGGNPGPSVLTRGAGVVLLSQIAVGALNDFSDRHLDRIGQPEKPIPSGLVGPRFALGLVFCSLTILFPLAATFGPIAFLLTVLGTSAGLAYDLWFKPTPFSLVGYLIGFLALITWIWVVSGNITGVFFFIYPAGALLLLAAHLAQSFPDIETDRSTGQRGLAAYLGPRATYAAIIVPVLVAASGGLAISLSMGSVPGEILNGAAAVLVMGLLSLRSRTLHERRARTLLFRLTAPIIALIVLGSLVALTSSS